MKDGGMPLRGVGGWLAFLVLGLTVLSPLRAIAETFRNIGDAESKTPELLNLPNWVAYKQWSWVLLAAVVSVSFAAGYRLWKVHHWDSVRFAIGALWAMGPGSLLVDMALTYALFRVWPLEAPWIGAFAASLITASAWTAYLLRSRRVVNTYLQSPAFVSA